MKNSESIITLDLAALRFVLVGIIVIPRTPTISSSKRARLEPP